MPSKPKESYCQARPVWCRANANDVRGEWASCHELLASHAFTKHEPGADRVLAAKQSGCDPVCGIVFAATAAIPVVQPVAEASDEVIRWSVRKSVMQNQRLQNDPQFCPIPPSRTPGPGPQLLQCHRTKTTRARRWSAGGLGGWHAYVRIPVRECSREFGPRKKRQQMSS